MQSGLVPRLTKNQVTLGSQCRLSDLDAVEGHWSGSSPTSSDEGAAPRRVRVGKESSKQFDSQSRKPDDNRQLNVVVYGIPECTKGQPRKQRWVSDLRNVTNLFHESSVSVPKSTIRDCRRLGKFSDSSSRPRPILVRFNSCNVVMDLLQKRSSFSPYVIKPDLPADVCLREKVLLKERWDLIQSGTCKSVIKIKGNTLLVNGSPFGRVDQSCNFVRCDDLLSPSSLSRSRSSSPTAIASPHDQSVSTNAASD